MNILKIILGTVYEQKQIKRDLPVESQNLMCPHEKKQKKKKKKKKQKKAYNKEPLTSDKYKR